MPVNTQEHVQYVSLSSIGQFLASRWWKARQELLKQKLTREPLRVRIGLEQGTAFFMVQFMPEMSVLFVSPGGALEPCLICTAGRHYPAKD